MKISIVSHIAMLVLGMSSMRMIGYLVLGYGNIEDVTAIAPTQSFGAAIAGLVCAVLVLIFCALSRPWVVKPSSQC